MTRIAINGFGRIGRNVLRALLERDSDLEVVAVNDLTEPVTSRGCSTTRRPHGFGRPVTVDGDALVVDGRRITVLAEREPAQLPWAELGVDIVLEATGRFTSAKAARGHLDAGAKKVLVSAPSEGADVTLAFGVNTDAYDPDVHTIVSNASCTTNALAPLAAVLDDLAGIEHGFMTTVHAYTQEQNLQDGPHRDARRARAAAVNIVPTTTGAAKAIGVVLPNLDGKLSGDSIRVPVPVGSIVELNTTVTRDVTRDEVLAAYRVAAEGPLMRRTRVLGRPARVVRHHGQSGFVDLRLGPHPRRRAPRQGGCLVRQRVGLLEPRDRYARAPRHPLTGRQGGTPPPVTVPPSTFCERSGRSVGPTGALSHNSPMDGPVRTLVDLALASVAGGSACHPIHREFTFPFGGRERRIRCPPAGRGAASRRRASPAIPGDRREPAVARCDGPRRAGCRPSVPGRHRQRPGH